MKWTSFLAIAGVAASLAAVPAAAHAQDAERAPAAERADSNRKMHGPHARTMAPGRVMMNPAERLLAQRTELALTADQVTRLESIRDRYAEKQKPQAEQMQRLHAERQKAQEGEARPERGARRERMKMSPEAQAIMDSIRADNLAVRTEAMSVLTDEQRTKVRELMQERRERRPREMRRQRDSVRTRGV